jgi:hypothetical protein
MYEGRLLFVVQQDEYTRGEGADEEAERQRLLHERKAARGEVGDMTSARAPSAHGR